MPSIQDPEHLTNINCFTTLLWDTKAFVLPVRNQCIKTAYRFDLGLRHWLKQHWSTKNELFLYKKKLDSKTLLLNQISNPNKCCHFHSENIIHLILSCCKMWHEKTVIPQCTLLKSVPMLPLSFPIRLFWAKTTIPTIEQICGTDKKCKIPK